MKKTFLFLVVALLLSGAGYAQKSTYSMQMHRLDFSQPQKQVTPTFPLVEGFEDEDFPPAGWTAYDVDGGEAQWKLISPVAHSGENSARHWYASPMQEGWLITPKITLPDDAESILDFWSVNAFAEYNYHNGIWISTTDNSIESFTLIKQLSEEELSSPWKKIRISLSEFMGSEIYIGFKYQGQNADVWYIDDVSVKYAGTDGAARKLYGVDSPMVGESFVYSASIENLSEEPLTGYTVNLIDDEDNILTFNTTGEEIAPNETLFVNMLWTPTTTGAISLRAVLVLPDDINLANNTTNELEINVMPASNLIERTIGTDLSRSFLFPINFHWQSSRTQTIYYSHEIMGGSGKIFQIQYFNDFVEGLEHKPIQIWMANTTISDLYEWLPESEFTLVFDGYIDFPIGKNTINIPLDMLFEYTGANLVIMTNRPMDNNYYSMNNLFYSTRTTDFGYRGLSYNSSDDEFNWTQPGVNADWHPNTGLSIALEDLGSASGIVTDGTTPLADAVVEIVGANQKCTTDANGNFNFKYVMPGEYQITVKKYGHFDATGSLTVTSNNNTEINITLMPFPRYTVSGKITDNCQTAGVQDVVINVTGYDDYATTTDIAGNFTIPNVYGGFTYNIQAKSKGYETYTSTFEVNEHLTHNIELTIITFPVRNPVAEIVNDKVVVNWDTPLFTTPKSYILDDGSFENGWAIASGFEAWLGNEFAVETSGTLTSIDLYGIQNPNASGKMVTIDIFNEKKELLGTSQQFQIPNDQWMNIPLDEIPYSGTFYVMVHWTDTDGDTNWIGTDENGANATAGWDILQYEGLWGSVHLNLGGEPFVFMMRANVNEDAKSVTYGADKNEKADNLLTGYVLYRFNEGAPESSWNELSTNISELLYTDNDWSTMPNGIYQYAVKAVFSGCAMSEARLTNSLVKSNIKVKESLLSNVKIYSYLNNVYIDNEANITIKSVEITDITGRKLYQNTISKEKTVIPLHVAKGIYFITLTAQNNSIYTTKIFIGN